MQFLRCKKHKKICFKLILLVGFLIIKLFILLVINQSSPPPLKGKGRGPCYKLKKDYKFNLYLLFLDLSMKFYNYYKN